MDQLQRRHGDRWPFVQLLAVQAAGEQVRGEYLRAHMSNLALRMDRVYKKFSRGERHDSLRDLIPALARQTVRRARRPLELKEEEFWAIDDVSFEIGKGEAIGVIGHN